MSRKVQLKDGTSIRYPDEKDIQNILKKLSDNDVIGSTILPLDAPIGDKIKYSLCAKILSYKILHNITQKELADQLKLDEPEISRVLHYKIERYSIERLLGYAAILYPNLTFEVLAE